MLVAGIAVLWCLAPTRYSLLFWLCLATAAVGVALGMVVVWLKPGKALSALQVIVGNALVLAFLLAVVEISCRAIGVNFETLSQQGDADPRAEYPLCFREPDEPFGDVYFKRAGPLEWEGRPLSTILKLRHGTDDAYQDEPVLKLHYDSEGFRNPLGLIDWDVVVAGDSFTETGYLPVEKIFTSIAAEKSGLRIKNLGLCNTGPLTHVEYLKQFGAAPSSRIAVLAFFEGNDVMDAEQESRDLATFQSTGQRPYRKAGPQTSFLKAVYRLAKTRVHFDQDQRYQNAVFTAGGKELGITLQWPPLPPDPRTMSAERMQVIVRCLDAWQAAAKKQGVQPWLLYLPVNNRTYHGLWRAENNLTAEARNWTPNQLPDLIRSLCEERGIRFVDAYPALRTAAEQGTLVYNPIFDTHLNTEGSQVVGKLLAKTLQSESTLNRP